MSVYDKFQKEIKEGASINESLAKYGLTLKDAFDYLNRPSHQKKKHPKSSTKVAPYIHEVNGKYHVRKRKKKGMAGFYGSFNTLADAQKIVQYYQENSWDKRRLDYACEKLGIKRNKRGGNHK